VSREREAEWLHAPAANDRLIHIARAAGIERHQQHEQGRGRQRRHHKRPIFHFVNRCAPIRPWPRIARGKARDKERDMSGGK
jgi:hypothetical protein